MRLEEKEEVEGPFTQPTGHSCGIIIGSPRAKCRVAVVSPFIDKRHGTERRVAEYVSRLGNGFETHLYSQRVEDVDLSGVVWHHIPDIPGPHLAKYVWWFVANHFCRWWDRRFRSLSHDLVYSPGINCLDADVISVHIVFAEFCRQMGDELRLSQNPFWFWPRLLHRRLYYGLIMFLERRVYSDQRTALVLIAKKTANDLRRFYNRTDSLPVVYLGLDHQAFNPRVRCALRSEVRRQLGIEEKTFVLLLIGNDWRKKGLRSLMEALRMLKELPLCLLVVGQDEPRPYHKQIRECGLEGRLRFLPPRAEIVRYYAAADAYVGPSLEDTFAQPPAEAMACGLPVITSAANGTSEIITNGIDGLILHDAMDADELALKIRLLYGDRDLCCRLGEEAAKTAQQYTWERNGDQIRAIFEQVWQRKKARECSFG